MTYRYDHPRPAVAADIVLWGVDGTDLHVLLIRRRRPPFQNCWALPGDSSNPPKT